MQVTEVVAIVLSRRCNTSRGEKESFPVLPRIRFGEGVVLRK